MSTADRDQLSDDDVAALLAQYDELLARGVPGWSVEKPTDSDDSLLRDQAFLERMEQVWPRADEPNASGEIDLAALPDESEISPPADDAAAELQHAEGATTRRLGRFLVRRLLGQGGTGIVFLADDPVLRRDVALKVPRPEWLISSAARRRFLREGEAAALLRHPLIVPVFEASEVGLVCYLISAYCDGPTLAQWLASQAQRVDVRLAADWISQLADAMHYAHQRGVLHRDIKPGNILLETVHDGAQPRFELRLADFGLAKCAEFRDLETRRGCLLGTPLYIAPEQAEGRLDEIGPAADVYSLGAVLYELLTGRPPFMGDSDLTILQQVVAAEPCPPARLRRGLSADLSAIVLRALEKKPANRYASAAELAADLRRFLSGDATLARPLGPPGRLVRWCRRKPRQAGGVGLALAASLAAFAAVTWQWQRAETHLLQVEQQRVRAEEHLRQENRIMSAVFRDHERGSWHRESQEPLIRAQSRDAIKRRYDEVIEAQNSTEYTQVEIATAFAKKALLAHRNVDAPTVLAWIDQSLRRWEALLQQDPQSQALQLGLADSLADATHVCIRFKQYDRAAQHVFAAEKIVTQPDLADPRYDEDRFSIALTMLSCAEAAAGAGQEPLVLPLYKRSLALWTALAASNSASPRCRSVMAKCHQEMGLEHLRRHHPEEALAEYQQALGIVEALLQESPTEPNRLSSLALTLRGIGRSERELKHYQQAIAVHEEAIRLFELLRAMGHNGPDADLAEVKVLAQLADLCGERFQITKASTLYGELIDRLRSLVREHPHDKVYRVELAKAWYQFARLQFDSRLPQVQATFEQACEEIDRLRSQDESDLELFGLQARSHFYLARILAAKKTIPAAQSHFALAASAYRRVLAERPHETGYAKDLAECDRQLAQIDAPVP